MVVYDQLRINYCLVLRRFNKELNPQDLKWHKDLDDRLVYSLLPTKWKIQQDNELPITITNQPLFIRKGTFHRLIPNNNSDLFLYVKSI